MTKKEAIDILRKVAMKTPVDCTDIKEPEKFYEAIDLAIKALEEIDQAENKLDDRKPNRVFERIITTFEKDGKPYYSIQFKENGEGFIGFGTYKIDVLFRYLNDYFGIEEADNE